MSIKTNQFIAIHIKSVNTYVQNISGRFMLRFHLYKNRKGQQLHFATPFNIIESQKCLLTQHSQTNQNAYITRLFSIGIRQKVTNLDEICIFKNDFDMFTNANDFKLEMCCQLIGYVPGSGKSVIATNEGILFQPTGSQYLEINFRSPYSIKVQGSIHTVAYNYQYCSTPAYPSLQAYCSSKSNQQVESLLKYLIFEGERNNQILENNKQFAIKNSSKNSIQHKQKSRDQEQQIKEKIMKIESYITERRKSCEQATQVGEDFIQFSPQLKHKSLSNPEGSFKRRRIFSKKKSSSQQITLLQFEKFLHQNAAKIFQNWNLMMKILLDNSDQTSSNKYSGQALFSKLKEKYLIKEKKKIGENIIKFKGSWDQDIYYHEKEIRQKIGLQIRNPLPQLVVEDNQFVFSSSNLLSKTRPIYFFQQADTQPQLIKPTPSKLIVFLVHGLGACRLDMQRLRVQLKRRYDEKLNIVISTANQGRTEGDISGMCIRLAQQIQHYMSREDSKKMPMISMIGHSMGGVIIRGALPKLQKYKHLFYSFISLSSPHIGYDYSTSKLVDAGLWVINNWKKCQSLQQLTMQDNQIPQQTFLYNLSKQKGLGWFSKIVFFSSRQDNFVPYYSARIQKSQQCIKDYKNKIKRGIVHCQMIESILDSIRGKVYRIQIDFCIQKKNIQNFIGRTAHISFLNDFQMLQTFSFCSNQILF